MQGFDWNNSSGWMSNLKDPHQTDLFHLCFQKKKTTTNNVLIMNQNKLKPSRKYVRYPWRHSEIHLLYILFAQVLAISELFTLFFSHLNFPRVNKTKKKFVNLAVNPKFRVGPLLGNKANDKYQSLATCRAADKHLPDHQCKWNSGLVSNKKNTLAWMASIFSPFADSFLLPIQVVLWLSELKFLLFALFELFSDRASENSELLTLLTNVLNKLSASLDIYFPLKTYQPMLCHTSITYNHI
jgi:hypothetical protein